jgi:hypothetical protein
MIVDDPRGYFLADESSRTQEHDAKHQATGQFRETPQRRPLSGQLLGHIGVRCWWKSQGTILIGREKAVWARPVYCTSESFGLSYPIVYLLGSLESRATSIYIPPIRRRSLLVLALVDSPLLLLRDILDAHIPA